MNNLPFISLFIILVACSPPVQEEQGKVENPVSEQFIRANQYSQRRNQDLIAAFVERVGWEAETTPTGLWIVVDSAGNGPPVEDNQRVAFTYESMLLTGRPCYKAGVQDPKVITIGRGGVESGVEEGLKRLHAGAVATLIIPPHLGHGNFGDRNRIPGNSILIYHLKVLEIY